MIPTCVYDHKSDAEWSEVDKDGKRLCKCTPMRPYVGMPATVCFLSDRHAATVIYVSKTAHKVVVREDTATRTDNNGMSESQTYSYTPNPNGEEFTFYRNSRGRYGRSPYLVLGFKDAYHDYSF